MKVIGGERVKKRTHNLYITNTNLLFTTNSLQTLSIMSYESLGLLSLGRR